LKKTVFIAARSRGNFSLQFCVIEITRNKKFFYHFQFCVIEITRNKKFLYQFQFCVIEIICNKKFLYQFLLTIKLKIQKLGEYSNTLIQFQLIYAFADITLVLPKQVLT